MHQGYVAQKQQQYEMVTKLVDKLQERQIGLCIIVRNRLDPYRSHPYSSPAMIVPEYSEAASVTCFSRKKISFRRQ